MLYYLLAVLYVVSCLLLLLVVLLQQGKGGDMANAFGGGGSQAAFGARAGATVLTNATSVLGVLFMIGAIALGVIGKRAAAAVTRAGHDPGEGAGQGAGEEVAHPRESGGTGRRTSLRGWRSQER